MSNLQFALYTQDLGNLVREKAVAAKLAVELDKSDYNVGHLMAWHEIVSLMQSQAPLFGISLSEMGLANLDPDRELL